VIAGLDWLRVHFNPADVVAVNNYYLDRQHRDPTFLYYSTLSQRRVYLEGWTETINSTEQGGRNPYPRRQVLNDASSMQTAGRWVS
jgi:hypothetical protein